MFTVAHIVSDKFKVAPPAASQPHDSITTVTGYGLDGLGSIPG